MSNFFSRLVNRAADRATDRSAQIRPNIAPHYAADAAAEGPFSDGAPAILEQEVEVDRSGAEVSARSEVRSAAAPRTGRLARPAEPQQPLPEAAAAPAAPRTQPSAAAPPLPKVSEAVPAAVRSQAAQLQAPQPQHTTSATPTANRPQQLAAALNRSFSPALQATLGRLAQHLSEEAPLPPPLAAEAEAEAKAEAKAEVLAEAEPRLAQSESASLPAAQMRAALPLQAPAAASQRVATPPSAEQAPVYRIHIGRIEVRAAAPSQPVKQPARAPVQGTTLAEYHRQIRGRRP